MRFGLFASLLLHLAIVGAAFLPMLGKWRPDVAPEPFIPVELIAEADLDLTTSVPAAAPEPEEEPEPEPDLPEPVLEEIIEPEPAPVEEEPEPEPEPEPVIEEAPDPEPDPEPDPPVKKPEPESDDLDLDALSKLIDKEVEAEERRETRDPSMVTETAEEARQAVGAGDRLTASVRAKMQAAVERCWNAGAIIGAPDPEKLIVTLEFELNRQGEIVSAPRVANALQINLSGNQFWKVAEREAISAVTKCAPYDFLPDDQYAAWKDMRLNFDPSLMVGR